MTSKNEIYLNENHIQSKTIDWLRFPLAIAVVFIHLNPIVDMQAIDYSRLSGTNVVSIVEALVSHVLTQIAVPCFFMFSGFLFFYKLTEWNRSVYMTKIKKRVMTLVIPYLLWNIIPIIITVIIKLLKPDGSVGVYFQELLDKGLWRIFWNYNVWESDLTTITGKTFLNYAPYLVPMWFLRDLIIMVFLSPLVYYLVKYTKLYGIGLLFILYCTKTGISIPGFSTELFLSAFFFFSLGAYFSIHSKNLVLSLRKGQAFWFPVALVSMVLSTYYDGSAMKIFFMPLYVLSGVISIINITSYFIEREKLKVSDILSKSSFFVYATHTIFILWFAGKLFDTLIRSDQAPILLIRYFSVPLISVLACLGLYFLMKRFVPGLLNVLTGDR